MAADVVTATALAEGPGKAGVRPMLMMSPRVVKMGFYRVTFGDHYLTGGDSFAAVSNDFNSVLGVVQTDSVTPGKFTVSYDGTLDQLLLFIEDAGTGVFAQAGNDSDQDAVWVDLLVFGY